MNLSEIIKEYRKENKLTMQELADRCGLSKGYISMLENKFKPTGRKKDIVPSIQAIKKISNGTGIDFDFLLSSIDGDVSLIPTKDELPISLDSKPKYLLSTDRDEIKELFDKATSLNLSEIQLVLALINSILQQK